MKRPLFREGEAVGSLPLGRLAHHEGTISSLTVQPSPVDGCIIAQPEGESLEQ